MNREKKVGGRKGKRKEGRMKKGRWGEEDGRRREKGRWKREGGRDGGRTELQGSKKF